MRKRFNKEKCIELLKNHSKKEVAEILEIPYQNLIQSLYYHKIKTVKNYYVNHEYFKTESHSMYYILGFITADGNIHNKRHYLAIELQLGDEEVLKFILEEISPKQNILYYTHKDKRNNKEHKSCKIAIYSKTIKEDLINIGIVPNKTKEGIFIDVEKIPEEYFYDFIRGLIDGDGSILKHENGIYTKITCSDKNFLIKIQKRINLPSSIQHDRNHSNLIYCHNSSKILHEKIYKDYKKSFTLERKREKSYACI